VKFATNSTGLVCYGPILCSTAAFRPISLTAADDNSVGDIISGSSGSPSGVYASVYLQTMLSADLEYLRVCYANDGIEFSGGSNILRNCQFVKNAGNVLLYGNAAIENCLFHNSSSFTFASYATVAASIQNCTIH